MDILESVYVTRKAFPPFVANPCLGVPRTVTVKFLGSILQWELGIDDARKLHAALGSILNEHTTQNDESGSGRPRRKVNPRALRK